MRSKKLLLTGMLCLSTMLVGCSSKAEEPKEEVVEKEEKKEGETLAFTNSTSKTITSIQIKAADDKEYGDNLLEEDLKTDTNVQLYPEAKKSTKYEIQFVADETTYIVKDLELGNMKSIALFLDGDTAYVEYTDKDGNKVSTKEEKKEEAPAEENTSTDPAVVEQTPVVEQAPAETYTESYVETPVYDDGGATAPADDGCLSGITNEDLN